MRQLHFGFVTFLTFIRFPLVTLFLISAVYNAWKPETWIFFMAWGMLIFAALTDLFDGYFARKLNVETSLGAHADPLMDKFFYLSTMPLLIFVASQNGNTIHSTFLLFLTFFFLARDQWVTFLRSIGSIYNISGKANWSGKLRTCINFPLICAIYHLEESPAKYQFLPPLLVYFFEGVSLVITVVSLYIYTKYYWPQLKKSASL